MKPAQILAKRKAGKKINKRRLSEAARELGKKGGEIGGYARADALNYDERCTIARHAINQRWGNLCPKDCPYCY
jgi:hypothetical protein